VAVVTGAAGDTESDEVASATGIAAVVTGSGVAATVVAAAGVVVVLDVQPAKSAETRSSPQTIPIRMSDCARDVGCMVIFLCT
jgi:negative regulator of sigma E activity